MSYMFPMFTWVGVFGFILMFFRPRWRYFSTSNSWWIGKADILYPLGIQQDNRNLIHLYTNFIFQVVTFIAISDYLWVTTGITLYSWPSPSTLKRIELILGHSKYVLCVYIYIYIYTYVELSRIPAFLAKKMTHVKFHNVSHLFYQGLHKHFPSESVSAWISPKKNMKIIQNPFPDRFSLWFSIVFPGISNAFHSFSQGFF